MNLLVFTLISVSLLNLRNKTSAIFLATIISSFFIYYLSLTVFGIELEQGGTAFIYLTFCAALVIFLLMRAPTRLTLNRLDLMYLLFFAAWSASYLVNFDYSTFSAADLYKQAPFFAAFTFLMPILLKPLYSEITLEKTIRYLEKLGFAAGVIIFALLILKFPSKEIWWDADAQNLGSIFRYAPIRGYFSNRQATLLSIAIVIFVSKLCYTDVRTRELVYKIPLAALCFAGIVISGSRAVFIICLLMSSYLLLKNLPLRRTLKFGVFVSLLIILFLSFLQGGGYQSLSARVLESESYEAQKGGVQTRIERYETGFQHFFESPVWGNGMSKMSEKYDYSHNIIISALEDIGLLGFGWLILLTAILLIACYSGRKKRPRTTTELVTRNVVFFTFLLSNLYGTIVSQTGFFLLLSLYYFNYRKNAVQAY